MTCRVSECDFPNYLTDDFRTEGQNGTMLTEATSDAVRSDRWIVADPKRFREQFNQTSFEVSHYLAGHPLFQLPALMELADRTLKVRPRDLHYDAGDVRVDQRWEEIKGSQFSPQEALRRVEDCGAWFVFKSAQRDPNYGVFLDRGLAELKAHMGPRIDSQIMVEDIIIFVTSPKRVTTYHIDRECNFLLQIRGHKTLHVFDREDREVLSEEEIERFWAKDFNAAVYKPALQYRAKSYRLVPGNGVHIPVNCPHWLENDNNISVSLSVNFQFKDKLRANAYRANFLLRKMGLRPTPPGRSVALDALKSYSIAPGVWAKKTYQRMARGT